ncbi:ribosome biogenesis protein YTM1, putative [Plasmodium vivax]|uniref:Microtubule-associated protein ytm1 homologue, putative n=4 Tax=Plasmodium vivax TaxID=5855 RepID=A5K2D6_PLAVS|nr:microtubule-associated protein ytm1 homologue, putative [Plasmodium vivax]KMZ79748.1 microtubule-associated protein ytm1 likeue [Plasmodium vivax India VII]KMZ98944.1 microtubule-associated protein ytm1 likeue [Plasmodium vivax North Korean]EDL46586.1 microtubule-associated protein ytm1 homologue, putative [Plasmodium vivax]CAI7721327.1 ribosome biogenesis protein YTM1, putative [Plasmodium vivax]SCO73556.1 ribosome biogenesis protein YTM1, putative [Plasmodium vivax]|eukprot:XP_001616313.1 microtubule-associated protein ytm1 homologue [Plasmodium vivax Sal-1]
MKKGGRKKKGARSNKLGKGKNDASEDEEVVESDSASEEPVDSDADSEEPVDSDGDSEEPVDSDGDSKEPADSDADSDADSLSDKEQASRAEKQIQIYFTSNVANEKYQMEDTIYTIPASFKRIDLSRMVKKLLDIKENVSFEFLINKQILRSSIEEFLQLNNILSENVIQIEYILSMTKKESTQIDKISEWISKLIIIEDKLYCSTFEGSVLCYDLSSFAKIDERKVADTSIFAFNVCKNDKLIDGEVRYSESAVGLSNGTIRAFLNEETDQKVVTRSELYLGNHDDMVKSIAFNRSGSLLISAGADNKINLYDNSEIVQKLKEGKSENNTSKRKLKHVLTPKKCIHKDVGIITALTFFDSNNRFLCTGLEKSIKIYDADTADLFATLPYGKAIMCSDIVNENLFVTADEQSVIKLFDVRCLEEKAVISLNEHKYFFHDKVVTSLGGNKNGVHFLSSSHDGFTNIYDVRLNKLPVYTIQTEDKSKVLASTWFYRESHNSVINADENNLTVHSF